MIIPSDGLERADLPRSSFLVGVILGTLLALSLSFLTGCMTVEAVGVSPLVVTWGSVQVGSKSTPQVVTLSNGGSGPISITSIAISGTNAGDFSISSSTCGSTLGATSNCAITLIFAPSAAGSRSATLTFQHSGVNPVETVTLSGSGASQGASTILTVAPGSLSFGSVNLGSGSASQTVTVQNPGATAIAVSNVSIIGADPSDFAVTTNSCGASVAASAGCTVSIIFNPTAAGSRTATLTLTDAAGNSPQTVALAGTGSAASTANATVAPRA